MSRTPPPSTPAPLLTLRSESDLLALVPFTLGFLPHGSLVAVVIDASRRPLVARVDLPEDPGAAAFVAEQLAVAARRHEAVHALLVAYTADSAAAAETVGVVVDRLGAGGVETLLALRAHDAHWFPVTGHAPPGAPASGTAYDLATHPLTSRAVVEGRVTHADRAGLAATVEVVDRAAAEALQAELQRLGPLPTSLPALRREGRWLRERLLAVVEALDRDGSGPDPELPVRESARLVRAVHHPDLRDLAWADLARERAGAHLQLWRGVVQRCPDEVVAPASALTALCAWLTGNGALAWCAVERAQRVDPEQSLARLVQDVLTGAVAPRTWRPFPLESARLWSP